MSEKNFSHAELIELLKSGNVPQKQIAALRLDYLETKSEADILLDNLVGCDGKIREAAALKINRFLTEDKKYIQFFNSPKSALKLAYGTIDINANICRLAAGSASFLKSCDEFKQVYLSKILEFIQSSFDELDKFIFKDKKYVINKQIFKLYWCLEAIKPFIFDIDRKTLFSILNRTSGEREYTIREKTAQILVLTSPEEFKDLKSKLKTDENYYVRAVFNSIP